MYASADGLAWSPDGSEIWFTAAETGGNRVLRAVAPSGRSRVLLVGAGSMTLQDVSRDGRVLMTHDLIRVGVVTRGPADPAERDLSWFDWSLLADLSQDGRSVLFTESGEGGGPGYSVFLRGTDGSPAVRLGEGEALALSPDGKRVLAIVHPTGDQQLAIYPTGPGEPKVLPLGNLRVRGAAWLGDNRRILMTASEPGHDNRAYLLDSEGGAPKPLTPEGHRVPNGTGLVDGLRFLTIGPERKAFLQSLDGGEPMPVPGILADDIVLGSAAKDGTIWVRRGRDLPARIFRLDLATGQAEPYKDLVPADPTGIVDVFGTHVTRDGRSWAFSYGRKLSDLYVVEGLR